MLVPGLSNIPNEEVPLKGRVLHRPNEIHYGRGILTLGILSALTLSTLGITAYFDQGFRINALGLVYFQVAGLSAVLVSHLLRDVALIYYYKWIRAVQDESRLEELQTYLKEGRHHFRSDFRGNTALMLPASCNNIKGAQAIINAKSDCINAQNDWGESALHIAFGKKNLEMAGLLLEADASTILVDQSGDSIYDLALQFETIRKKLIEKGNKNRLLHIASSRGDLSFARELLEAGADINSVDENGNNALMHAIEGNHLDVVKALLDAKIQINHTNKKGESALTKAAELGRNEIARLLLLTVGGINVNHRASDLSALDHATLASNVELVEVLMMAGANAMALSSKLGKLPLEIATARKDYPLVNALILHTNLLKDNENFETWFWRAIEFDMPNIIEAFSKMGYGVNLIKEGERAILKAIRHGHINVVKTLIKWGADVTLHELHVAIIKRNLPIFKVLAETGCDLNLKDKGGKTLLHHAIETHQKSMVEFLLDRGVDHSVEHLNLASSMGHHEITELFADLADPTDTFPSGDTWLHRFAAKGCLKGVRYMISRGVNINVLNRAGDTPLVKAASAGHREVVRFLMDYGDNRDITIATKAASAAWDNKFYRVSELFAEYLPVGTINDSGLTWLHHFASTGLVEGTRTLIRRGADINHRNIAGETALTFAACNQEEEMVEMLLGVAGFNPEAQLNKACDYAMSERNSVIIRMLIKAGAKPKESYHYLLTGDMEALNYAIEHNTLHLHATYSGLSPLMIAVYGGSRQVIDRLLAVGANLNFRDIKGLSAPLLAARIGDEELVSHFLKMKLDSRIREEILLECRRSGLREEVRSRWKRAFEYVLKGTPRKKKKEKPIEKVLKEIQEKRKSLTPLAHAAELRAELSETSWGFGNELVNQAYGSAMKVKKALKKDFDVFTQQQTQKIGVATDLASRSVVYKAARPFDPRLHKVLTRVPGQAQWFKNALDFQTQKNPEMQSKAVFDNHYKTEVLSADADQSNVTEGESTRHYLSLATNETNPSQINTLTIEALIKNERARNTFKGTLETLQSKVQLGRVFLFAIPKKRFKDDERRYVYMSSAYGRTCSCHANAMTVLKGQQGYQIFICNQNKHRGPQIVQWRILADLLDQDPEAMTLVFDPRTPGDQAAYNQDIDALSSWMRALRRLEALHRQSSPSTILSSLLRVPFKVKKEGVISEIAMECVVREILESKNAVLRHHKALLEKHKEEFLPPVRAMLSEMRLIS